MITPYERNLLIKQMTEVFEEKLKELEARIAELEAANQPKRARG